MVRPLSEYDLTDWIRLRVLTHALKTARYHFITARYVRRPAASGDVSALVGKIAGTKILTTIAFGDAEAIEWQIHLVRNNVPSASMHLIADNSRDDRAAARVAAVCGKLDTPYVRLPPNPWPQPSRSHGIALNWVWHNLIRPGEPEAFGFLDHDIFPIAPDDPFAVLSGQDCYGVVRTAGTRWFLWPGYCVFRFDRVRGKALDFGQNWFCGLDTGGGNWSVLYQHIDRRSLKEAPSTFQIFKAGIGIDEGALQWVGPWLHEVGQMVRADFRAERRAVVRDMLASSLIAAQEDFTRPTTDKAQLSS